MPQILRNYFYCSMTIHFLCIILLCSLLQETKDIIGIVDNVMNVDLQKLKEAQNDGSATNRYTF